MKRVKRVTDAGAYSICSQQADALFKKVLESATSVDRLSELFQKDAFFAGQLGQTLNVFTFWINNQHPDGMRIAAFFFAKTLRCEIFALEHCLVSNDESVRALALNYVKLREELGLN
jgi:hypothetical protein